MAEEYDERLDWLDWWPDWLTPIRRAETTDTSNANQTHTETFPDPGPSVELDVMPPRTVSIQPRAKKTVNRKLKGIHLFMITINATLGTGLYWRGGQVLEVGGALAVPLTFLAVGVLSWAVMQCISEMLCIWPVPGALGLYVGEFVDEELGIATSIAHWFTYAMSFSTLVPTAAGELDFWPSITGSKLLLGGVIYFCIPLFLVFVNLFRVETYGLFEVVSGSIKMLFLLIIAAVLIAINRGAGPDKKGPIGIKNWSHATAFDESAAGHSWFTAFLMCISIATFAYVGVEVVAASALEAEINEKEPNKAPLNHSSKLHVMNSTVKYSAIYTSHNYRWVYHKWSSRQPRYATRSLWAT